jgi:hypothetical protein
LKEICRQFRARVPLAAVGLGVALFVPSVVAILPALPVVVALGGLWLYWFG